MAKLLGFLALLVSLLVAPSQAQSLTLLNSLVTITYVNNGTQTRFTVTSPLDSSVNKTSAWLAVGFNTAQQMVPYMIFLRICE
jgi:hypothetical protein